ncbi:hypothetical protein LINPERPRIM_LOCUS14419 [Linum perenne]
MLEIRGKCSVGHQQFWELLISLLAVSYSFEVQTTHRQDRWNQDDEADVSRQK